MASGGFASNISLSASPAIGGVSFAFAPNPLAPNASATLTASTTSAAAPGNYNVTVTGNHTFAWDGKMQSGLRATDGNYTVKITAVLAGQPTGIAVDAEGTVNGVDLSADPPVLLVNGTRLTLERVRQVRQPGAPA